MRTLIRPRTRRRRLRERWVLLWGLLTIKHMETYYEMVWWLNTYYFCWLKPISYYINGIKHTIVWYSRNSWINGNPWSVLVGEDLSRKLLVFPAGFPYQDWGDGGVLWNVGDMFGSVYGVYPRYSHKMTIFWRTWSELLHALSDEKWCLMFTGKQPGCCCCCCGSCSSGSFFVVVVEAVLVVVVVAVLAVIVVVVVVVVVVVSLGRMSVSIQSKPSAWHHRRFPWRIPCVSWTAEYPGDPPSHVIGEWWATIGFRGTLVSDRPRFLCTCIYAYNK